MLTSERDCRNYLATKEPSVIAARLRYDQELCRNGKPPSLLALYTPEASSTQADAISLHLLQSSQCQLSIPRMVRLMHYRGVVDAIKAHLHQMSHFNDFLPTEDRTTPTTEDFEAALKVIDYLKSTKHLTTGTPLITVINAIRSYQQLDPKQRSAANLSFPTEEKQRGNRKCYICRFEMTESHHQYASLCRPCGNFNVAESRLSLPGSLDLSGKTALVSGGRVNLGFHVSLRLLRCGAKVIVSTRYPRDAEVRFRAQTDSDSWTKRLKIVGADFRTAQDVFRLVAVVKHKLNLWEDGELAGYSTKLDLLINNAAQTLTDSIATENDAVRRERMLQLKSSTGGNLLIDDDNGYEARVRKGVQLPGTLRIESTQSFSIEDVEAIDTERPSSSPEIKITKRQKSTLSETGISWNLQDQVESIQNLSFEDVAKDGDADEITEVDKTTAIVVAEDRPSKSSWVQSMEEIPYEDVITAHSVNSIVPLILCRELLPLLGESTPSEFPYSTESKSKSKPTGYIINVSSREGIFESKQASASKNGRHVHTNMSKAALNMITETESTGAWKNHRVAINTVDPGYMSAAPEMVARGDCPIGFEDGAARVLWPVAMGEKGTAVYGRFLKHFGEGQVEVGLGR